MDTDGNPILDMYSFIAKDIRYDEPSAVVQPGDEVPETPTDPTNPSAPTTNPANPEQTILVVNKYIESDMANFTSKTTNTDVIGFIVAPSLIYEENDYQLTVAIDAINCNADKFYDIKMTVIDQALKVNLAYEFKDASKNVHTTCVLDGADRSKGSALYKRYKEDSNYAAACTVQFTTKIDGKEITQTIDTTLWAMIKENYNYGKNQVK